MGEFAALVVLASVGCAVAGLLVLFHVRVVPRRPYSSQRRATDRVRGAGDPRDAARALGRFQVYAALFVAFAGLALLLTAWVARVDSLGRAGLGVAALIAAPLLVGFAHIVACGDLGDLGSLGDRPGRVPPAGPERDEGDAS